MVVLTEWLTNNVPEFYFRMVQQWRFNLFMRRNVPAAIFTYNKSLYKKKTVKNIIAFCEKGGKVIALHHNVSSVMLRRPEWLAFTDVDIKKGEKNPYPWSVIEGGDLFLLQLNSEDKIMKGVVLEGDAPELNQLAELQGLKPPENIHLEGDKRIVSFEIPPEIHAEVDALPRAPALVFKKSEYFINLVLNPNPNRELLFAAYFEDPESGRRYFSANGAWKLPRGEGVLYYFMPGHSTWDFTEEYCKILRNCLLEK